MHKTLNIILAGILFFFGTFTYAATVLLPVQGGTGTSAKPTYGQVLVGNAGGTYTPTATSSLGISSSSGFSTTSTSYWLTQQTTSGLTEGSDLYFTNARAQNALSGTYPITLTSGVFALAFGTTTANTWSQLQNFSNATSTLFTATTAYLTNITNTGVIVNNGGVNLGSNSFAVNTNFNTILWNNAEFGWSTSAGVSQSTNNFDIGLSRVAAGKLSLDTSVRGNTAGTLILATLGVATSSPFAKFSIAGASLGTTPLVSVSTSTATATTTIFSIDQNGNTTIGANGSVLTIAGATTSASNGVNITSGCFAINGTCVTGGVGGSGTVTSIATTYPLLGGTITNSGTLSLAFGTTTANTWGGTQTFTNAPTVSAFSAGTINATATGGLYSIATSSLAVSSPLTTSGTAGALIGGSALTIGCQTASGSQIGCLSSTDWTTFNNKQAALAFSYPLLNTSNTVSLAWGTTTANTWSGLQAFTNAGTTTFSGPASVSALAVGSLSGLLRAVGGYLTATLVNLASDVTGVLGVSNGGTGATSLSSFFSVVSNVLKANERHSFTYATSTAWSGTTTVPLEVGYGEIWQSIRCFTDTGTVNVQVGYGSASTTMFSASTTVGTISFSSNNTMTVGNLVKVDLGTPSSTPSRLTCTETDQI